MPLVHIFGNFGLLASRYIVIDVLFLRVFESMFTLMLFSMSLKKTKPFARSPFLSTFTSNSNFVKSVYGYCFKNYCFNFALSESFPRCCLNKLLV